ncbi:MAG: 2TM domain-containing protein [Chitinophagaceae bacterium]
MELTTSFQNSNKDPQLWAMAQRRAGFKTNVVSYLAVNAFLWMLWYFTGASTGRHQVPWPLYPTLGWGIGLVIHYIRAYVYPRQDLAEREYQKLMQQNNRL